MFGVRLREHEEFGVGGIASQFGVALGEVVDLVVGQRQAQFGIRLGQRRTRIAAKRDVHQVARLAAQEQTLRLIETGQHRLRHGIVQHRQHIVVARVACRGQPTHLPGGTALDPMHVETGVMQDVGGFAGPWRDRAQARHHPQRSRLGLTVLGFQGFEQTLALLALRARSRHR